MSVTVNDKNLGHATAYAYAKSKGYTGTEEEFAELMASYAEVATDAKGYADDAEQSATDAEQSATDAQQSATDSKQYAQQAKESAESIDMSSFATKAELSEFESEVSQTYATSASLSAVNDELNDTKVALNDAIEDFAVPTQEAVDNWLNEHPEATTTVQDGSITTAKLAPDVIGAISRGAISNEVKIALLDIFKHVAFIDQDGQDYYDALEDALNPPANLSHIGAVFNQADNIIYDNDSLDNLKQYLTVTAYYDDGTNSVINSYTLSGTLEADTSIITVSYGGKTTTFDVVVSANHYEYLVRNYINRAGASNQEFVVTDINLADGDYIEWSLSNVLTNSVKNDSVLRVGSNNGGTGLWTFANGQKYLVYTNKDVGISQIVCVVNGQADSGTTNYNVNNTPAGTDDIVIRMDKDGLIINNVRWTTSNAQYATLKEWMLAQTTLYFGVHGNSAIKYNYICVFRA